MGRCAPSLVFAALFLSASCAFAQQPVGTATTVVRDVRQAAAGDFQPLREGDSVFGNNRIRTAQDSSAVLTMADVTRVAIGPASEIVLDQFFVSGGTPAVAVTKGIFRFVSGPGGSGVHYRVRTPHASIAVRGTRFDVRVANGMTTIVLFEGAVDVCRGEGGSSCRSLAPGQEVDVSASGIYPATNTAPGNWTFEGGRGSAQTRAALALGRSVASAPSGPSRGGAGGSIWADASDPLFDRPNRDSNRIGFSGSGTQAAPSSASATASSARPAASSASASAAGAGGPADPGSSGSGTASSSSASASSTEGGGAMSAQTKNSNSTRSAVVPSRTDVNSGTGLGNVTITITPVR